MNITVIHKANRAQGFSLVELMIAMTLGLILTSGMIAVFAGNQRSSELNSALANIQENARFALNQIAADTRISGYQGCVDLNSLAALVLANEAPLVNSTTAIGMRRDLRATSTSGSVIDANGNWIPAAVPDFVPHVDYPPIPGTQTLTLQYAQPSTAIVSQSMVDGTGAPNPTVPVVVGGFAGLSIGGLAIISDCNTADLFRVTGLADVGGGNVSVSHAATGTPTGNMQGNFSAAYSVYSPSNQSRVMNFVSNIYYVADTGLKNEEGDRITALYQQSLPYDNENPPTELVQGVENLRVNFGMRTGTRMRYVRADDPSYNPRNVESIQVGLLMTSWDRISQQDDNSTYVLAGQSITPASSSSNGFTHASDKRYRLAFNTTIKVRNRR